MIGHIGPELPFPDIDAGFISQDIHARPVILVDSPGISPVAGVLVPVHPVFFKEHRDDVFPEFMGRMRRVLHEGRYKDLRLEDVYGQGCPLEARGLRLLPVFGHAPAARVFIFDGRKAET